MIKVLICDEDKAVRDDIENIYIKRDDIISKLQDQAIEKYPFYATIINFFIYAKN